MGRAERRAQERRDKSDMFSNLPDKQRQQASRLMEGKITPAEFKRICDDEFNRGYRMAAKESVAQVYAAAAIAVKRMFKTTPEESADFLVLLDEVVNNCIDSREAIDRAFEESGVELDFEDPFATVKRRLH